MAVDEVGKEEEQEEDDDEEEEEGEEGGAGCMGSGLGVRVASTAVEVVGLGVERSMCMWGGGLRRSWALRRHFSGDVWLGYGGLVGSLVSGMESCSWRVGCGLSASSEIDSLRLRGVISIHRMLRDLVALGRCSKRCCSLMVQSCAA